jgi:[ribosomal protein S5]-alanine N-acetyltransferase
MRSVSDAQAADEWRLQRAAQKDVDRLVALASEQRVYRYLFDGVAPDREFIARRVAQSLPGAAETGFGMWLLGDASLSCAGGVELRPYPAPGCAELTYLLHPDYWGRGLAMRMAWTVITQAFLSSRIEAVIAGADLPNTASFAVMRRLGMRFHKDVRYPLGAGVEYILRRQDAGPRPRPALIRLE